MATIKTIDLKGKAYAQVKDRLKEFRSQNPNALIETTPTIQPDGAILFRARILKDKADPNSGEATGNAMGPQKGDKAFEKLETIAVGRALAFLGYAADGEIASSEEMEAFEEYKQQQFEDSVMEWQDKLSEAADLKALGTMWADVPAKVKLQLTKHKDTLKAKYESK